MQHGLGCESVEYVKDYTNPKTVMIHVGADLFLRKCYRPEDWHHEVTVLDKHGRLKSDGPKQKYVIAGPLCFSGDMIAKDIELPVVQEGDYILIHDVGRLYHEYVVQIQQPADT